MSDLLIKSHSNKTDFNQDNLYKELTEIKFNKKWWDILNSKEKFRYDYKDYKISSYKMGISSVLYPLNELFNETSIIEDINEYMINEDLDIYIIMSLLLIDNLPRREIYIKCKDEKIENEIIDYLKDKINLSKIHSSYNIFNQDNKISRKLLSPILIEIINKI